jgi:hypothetical protein
VLITSIKNIAGANKQPGDVFTKLHTTFFIFTRDGVITIRNPIAPAVGFIANLLYFEMIYTSRSHLKDKPLNKMLYTVHLRPVLMLFLLVHSACCKESVNHTLVTIHFYRGRQLKIIN